MNLTDIKRDVMDNDLKESLREGERKGEIYSINELSKKYGYNPDRIRKWLVKNGICRINLNNGLVKEMFYGNRSVIEKAKKYMEGKD